MTKILNIVLSTVTTVKEWLQMRFVKKQRPISELAVHLERNAIDSKNGYD